ncbi:MAG: FmdB family zinc ribbon protein [Actinomycetota bacterium]
MPTYEYVCSSCRRHTEAQQRFSDPPLTECPYCGGVLKRVFHPVGIVLKGSGFYSTDNRSGKSKTAAQTSSGSEAPASESKTGSGSESATKSDSKSEAKPKEKSETKTTDKSKKAAK